MEKIFGSRLAKLRGPSPQREIAEFLGVKQQTYSSWERNEKEPCIEQIKTLALHYGVSTDWLFGIESETTKKLNVSSVNKKNNKQVDALRESVREAISAAEHFAKLARTLEGAL